MEIKIIKEKITREELESFAQKNYGDMIKAAVDIEKGIISLGGELHSDSNEVLIKQGSNQRNIWGINIYPARNKKERIEFISLINVRPADNNFDMEIEDKGIREKIKKIIDKLMA